MTVKVIPYEPEHLDLFELVDDFDIYSLAIHTRCDYKNGNNAGTILIDGVPVFACGVKIDHPGVGYVWLIRSKYSENHKITLVKFINKVIDEAVKENKIHKLFTFIDEKFEKWIEFLGFEEEAVLRQFTSDKKNMKVYTKFFNN